MPLMSISSLYFQCGSLVLKGVLTLKHKQSDWSRKLDTIINAKTGPMLITVPEGEIELHHQPTVAVSLSIVRPEQVLASGKKTYQRVSLTVHGKGKCAVCGKRMTRKKEVWQTYGPYNKTAEGKKKTKAAIWKELEAEALEWEKHHLTHVKCES